MKSTLTPSCCRRRWRIPPPPPLKISTPLATSVIVVTVRALPFSAASPSVARSDDAITSRAAGSANAASGTLLKTTAPFVAMLTTGDAEAEGWRGTFEGEPTGEAPALCVAVTVGDADGLAVVVVEGEGVGAMQRSRGTTPAAERFVANDGTQAHFAAEAFQAAPAGQQRVTTPATRVGAVRCTVASRHVHVASLPEDEVEPSGHAAQERLSTGPHAALVNCEPAKHGAAQVGHATAVVPIVEKVPALHEAHEVSAATEHGTVRDPGPQAAAAALEQGVQTAAIVPAAEKEPATQLWHAVSAVNVQARVDVPGPHAR